MLRERTQAVLPDSMEVVLRFFDPRVFAALLNHLDADALRGFLSAATVWALPDRRGEVHVIAHGVSELGQAFVSPMRLNATQESALIDAGEADAIVDLLLNQNNDRLLTMIPPDQHEHVAAAIAQTRHFGIEHTPEQLAFCAAALAFGADFHTREPWLALMPEVKAARINFSEAVSLAAKAAA